MSSLKKIALLCFILGLVMGCSFFIEQTFQINWIPISIAIQLKLFLFFGCMGFILNLISYKNDRKGKENANLLYWIGAPLVLLGLLLKFKFSSTLIWVPIILGLLLLLISQVINSEKKFNESNLIDSDE